MRKWRGWVLLGGAACTLAAVIGGRMVLQPGPYDFAGGTKVDLAAYTGRPPVGAASDLVRADPLRQARYITDMADCEACHTAKGGQPFAGGRPFVLPFGIIYSPNITPDKNTGIGKWTDRQFLDAVHRGVAPDGKRYYPAFPFATYTMLADKDVLAIKSYLFSLPPVKQANKANTFAFPFNQRWLMGVWSGLFNDDQRFRPVRERSAEWNRGAYLVEAAGHCGECHTPRNLFQALDQRRKFAGGQAEGWNAYNITGDRISGLGGWSDTQLTAYLSTGHAQGRGVASGPMGEVTLLSLSRLSGQDIRAIVTYLRTVPAIRNAGHPEAAASAPADPRDVAGGDLQGKRMFEGNCASCHAWSGAGALVAEAQLTGTRAVNDPTAANVALMILNGSGGSPGQRRFMPGFAAAYSDAEVSALANYVTRRFGSRPSSVTAQDVAKLREH